MEIEVRADGEPIGGQRALGEVESLRERARRVLRLAVAEGRLSAVHIYSVPTVAAKLWLSATPVREAMLELVGDQLMEAVPNRGFRLVIPPPEEMAKVGRIRLMLEPPTIGGLCHQLTPLQIEGLRGMVDRVRKATLNSDVRAAIETDNRFHDVLVGLSDNDRLIELIARLRAQVRVGEVALAPSPTSRDALDRIQRLAPDGRQLLDELEAHRESEVQMSVRRYIKRSVPHPYDGTL
ncbi:MAG: GntR family transcriptional regulator [Nocardioidaceae bacterium]